jgi:hypothetical protein
LLQAEWGILTDRDIIEARGDVVENEHQAIINKNDVLFQDLAQKFLDDVMQMQIQSEGIYESWIITGCQL